MFITKFLQLAFPAYLICVHMVLCQQLSHDWSSSSGQGVTILHLQQNSECGGRFVQVRTSVPVAVAYKSRYTELNVTSISAGVMTIRGIASGRFICFSKTGKLGTRVDARKGYCHFKDSLDEDYSVYSLHEKPHWKLAFNCRTGKPIGGNETHIRHGRKTHQFLHSGKSISYTENYGPGPVLPPDVAEVILGKNRLVAQQSVAKKSRSGTRSHPKRKFRRRRTPRPRTSVHTTRELSVSNRSTGVLDQRTTPIPLIRHEPELLRTLRLIKLLS